MMGCLLGGRKVLAEAWDLLVAEVAPRGFHLSREKSLVSCQDHKREDRDPLRRGVTRVEGGGFKLLGAPIGSWDYEEQILEERLVSIQRLLDSLHLRVVLIATHALYLKNQATSAVCTYN